MRRRRRVPLASAKMTASRWMRLAVTKSMSPRSSSSPDGTVPACSIHAEIAMDALHSMQVHGCALRPGHVEVTLASEAHKRAAQRKH